MGGPDMAPHTPPPASRSSRGLDRSSGHPVTAGGGRDPAGGAEVPVITDPRVHVHEGDLAGRERDTLVLTAEERRWGRRRATTTGGRGLALGLPPRSPLTPGQVLHLRPGLGRVVGG